MPNTIALQGVAITRSSLMSLALVAAIVTAGGAAVGCRPGDVLSVPPPAGVSTVTAYQSQAGAEQVMFTAKAQLFQGFSEGNLSGIAGVIQWAGLLSDEFTWDPGSYWAEYGMNVDARFTAPIAGYGEEVDPLTQQLFLSRWTLLTALPLLEKYEPVSGQPTIAEAFALLGYAELFLAENYCAGVPLDMPNGVTGITFGMPLTTDSLLGAAESAFDSAVAHAGTDPNTSALASVGLGRARLDRGHYAAAATAVSGVPTAFVYNASLQIGNYTQPPPDVFNLYDYEATYNTCIYANPADREGGTGINYVSANDPRLVLDSTSFISCEAFFGAAGAGYYPVKFGNPSLNVPMATGVEARLIEAEAAYQANPAGGTWAADLRGLRGDTADTHVAFPVDDSLPADSAELASASAQVDLMFRERAFWLYGTGFRLGDMRRLIRQYGRDQSTVYAVGAYPLAGDATITYPIPSYGGDVSLTLPLIGSQTSTINSSSAPLSTPNPNYKGCITSTKTA